MLQDMRKSKNLSQKQLAENSGVKLRMIQHYEQGARDINGAGLGTLLDLSLALNCDLPDILSDQQLIDKYKSFKKQTGK